MTYRAPVERLAFALDHVARVGRLRDAGLFPDFDADVQAAVLDGVAALAEDVLAPLNREGDRAGATLDGGEVRAAPGFGAAYAAYVEGGWGSLAADETHGGQALPRALALAVYEPVHSANMAFGLCPMLTQGAVEALAAHGSARQQALFLPRLVSGEWTGAMCLTEPQAGSDLSTVRTVAEPAEGGGFRLTGEKIYITWGDHDVAPNVIHLVLARIRGAAEGTRGLSLFLCPKFLTGDDGVLGARNGWAVTALERKLGIHASPTCAIRYDGAQAELVGEPGHGLAHMFTMMNAARLSVGLEGVAIGERALQQALAYAGERRQGRSAWSAEAPAAIADLPDVRRTLALMRARVEAGRAICLLAAVEADLGAFGDAGAQARYELLVPVAKGWCTDMGVWAASAGVQVHGGAGYVEDTGAAQHLRDARIAPIYEGTNGVQALDLIGRKLGTGESLEALCAEMAAEALNLPDRLIAGRSSLLAGVAAAQTAGEWLIARRGTTDAQAGATTFLQLLGDVVGGWLLGRAAAAEDDEGRSALFNLYAGQVLSAAPALAEAVMQGQDVLEALTPDRLR